ncbi:MAG: 3-dehydroquinate synthase [Phycisphaerae bacterium]|jgi:3-dehydroquinate synthase|nr:3-dehydroquinate synthase [Phycisphaerae bacterium]MDP7287491.1 3-dehydroquinate synthase [Phycisphaerae bacterium]
MSSPTGKPNTHRQTAAAADVYHQQFAVSFNYPVHFARNVLAPGDPLLARVFDRLDEQRVHRVAVFLDSGVSDARPEIVDEIKEYFHAHSKTLELASGPTIVPGGERAKNGWKPIRDILWTAGNIHLDRQSYVLAIGGGAMLDAVGFAASLVHRGVRMVRMPSTVLAQNDAGVGVKTSMDEHGQKNFIGTFAPPFAVVNDFSLLETLTDRDWTGGIAEAFKVAIIKDADFLEFLCDNAAALKNRDAAAMETLVRRCAIIHLDHIASAGDPFETGSARPLDFGHWSAHKLETMSDYWVGHGQAVAVGIALDSYYAMHEGMITSEQFERILEAMTACGLPIYVDYLSRTTGGVLDILTGLADFREHLGGRLNVTLPDGLGAKCELHHLEDSIITEAIEYLRTRNAK